MFKQCFLVNNQEQTKDNGIRRKLKETNDSIATRKLFFFPLAYDIY